MKLNPCAQPMKGAQSFVCCLSWHAEDSQIENGLWLGCFVKQKRAAQ